RRRFGVDGEHAFLALLLEIGLELVPDRLRAFGGPDQECLVAGIGRHVAGDEIAHVDGRAPATLLELSPATLVLQILRQPGSSFHDVLPNYSVYCPWPLS